MGMIVESRRAPCVPSSRSVAARAIASAWLSLVVVEQINATSGIGYMMSLARSYGQTEIIIVGLAVYGSLGFASDTAIRWIERRALTWRRTLAG